jgi:hypothetical protein
MNDIDAESRETKFKKELYIGFKLGFLAGIGIVLGLLGICAILVLAVEVYL